MRANLVNYLKNFVTPVLFVVKLSCKILSTNDKKEKIYT